MATKMPTLFVCHGAGPSFFADWPFGDDPKAWHPMADWLAGLLDTLPERPRGVVVVSGHHVASKPTITASESPRQLDLEQLKRFPVNLPDLKYESSGDPRLAAQVHGLLARAGIAADTDVEHGFDHGVWIPLRLFDPAASLPVVAVSLVDGFDGALHCRIGRALAPLRDEGVLVLGSGASFHNMELVRRAQSLDAKEKAEIMEGVDRFDAWLEATLALPWEERLEALARWRNAPGAAVAHDTGDHLAPLFVVAGSGWSEQPTVAYRDRRTFAGVPQSMYRYG